jgi:hypothetical protein
VAIRFAALCLISPAMEAAGDGMVDVARPHPEVVGIDRSTTSDLLVEGPAGTAPTLLARHATPPLPVASHSRPGT